jgi:hypothetical protein
MSAGKPFGIFVAYEFDRSCRVVELPPGMMDSRQLLRKSHDSESAPASTMQQRFTPRTTLQQVRNRLRLRVQN